MFIVYVFPKKKEKALIPLFILSFISGFGNAIVIFSVVEALKKVDQVNLGLLLYYGLGILFYVAGQKLIRNKMIELTHNLVYEKRSKLIQNLLHTPFYKFEKIDRGEIYAVLKGDTELVSHLPSIAVSAMTNLVTVLFCLVYLSIVNFGGLLVSVSILVLASVIYFLMARSADTLWEQSRDIQNHFFSYINDLVQGFKELSLSRRRRYDFSSDLDNSNLNFRAKNIKAGYKFTNAFVVGELLFVLVIGGIAFVFPVLFTNIQSVTLSTFVFVFLYMTGPINALLDVIPELVQIRISWNRLNQLIQNTSQHKVDQISHPRQTIVEYSKKFTLENVEYEYDNGEESFRIGPISYEFRIGEITFITGGNGSGKTTFAKLLTGLYKAKNGTILLDGQELDHSEIGEYFSNVFSDFYLFKRIYGIETAGKEEQINTYLELLQMQEKVDIVDGKFSTIDLSTGQRKRLALLISYLEDKPFCLFDEWAADQDPEFRKFFYEDLLSELKRRGKCVIAITHDDRYFYLADKIIKMNAGEVEYIEGLTEISS
ncbi:cyclic peptide export ABC transporter [Paenibacillus larvae]